MISRTWHGIVPLDFKDSFKEYLDQTGVKDTKEIGGNRSTYVKIIEQGEYAHFFLCTFWQTIDDVIKYAGNNPEIAVTYQEDIRYKLISDPIVIHLKVSSSDNPFT